MEFHPADVSLPMEVEVCTTEETCFPALGEPIAIDTKCVCPLEPPPNENGDCPHKTKAHPTISDEKSGVEKKIVV